jgi:formate dehydrogenase accessory protein FdhE
VPEGAAQDVTDALVRTGVKGILNSSPRRIVVPRGSQGDYDRYRRDVARLPYYLSGSRKWQKVPQGSRVGAGLVGIGVDRRLKMSSMEQGDLLKPARGLAEGIQAVRATVSDEELFDRFRIERGDATIREKLRQGKPLLDVRYIRVRNAAAERTFELLLDVFREHLAENAADWEKLEQASRCEEFAVRDLLEATLGHRWDVLQAWAQRSSLDMDTLQFLSIYLARPFREQVAQHLWDETQTALWQEGYCPVCGHSPVLGRLLGSPGHRQLWCCCCNTAWSFPRMGCPFCKNQSQDQLGYLSVPEFSAYRVYVCDRCKRYLKTGVCSEESGKDGWDYDREYFSTAVLDSIALREGYVAEPVWLAHGELPVDSSPFPVG